MPIKSQKIKKSNPLSFVDKSLNFKNYDDKLTWLTASIAELSYMYFDPLLSIDLQKEQFFKKASQLIGKEKVHKFNDEESTPVQNLSPLNMELIRVFNKQDMQAILVRCNDFIVLSFRGYKGFSLKEAVAILDSQLIPCNTGGRAHKGFSEEFVAIGADIQIAINQNVLAGKTLLICGHGLGAALATIAAKKLIYKNNIAACYAFGSPRVGNSKWISGIRVPLYRLVNTEDLVTTIPLNYIAIEILGALIKFIPVVGDTLENYMLANFDGYAHAGKAYYLSNCKDVSCDDVKLMDSPNVIFIITSLWRNKRIPWKGIFVNHKIDFYRKKLEILAFNEDK